MPTRNFRDDKFLRWLIFENLIFSHFTWTYCSHVRAFFNVSIRLYHYQDSFWLHYRATSLFEPYSRKLIHAKVSFRENLSTQGTLLWCSMLKKRMSLYSGISKTCLLCFIQDHRSRFYTIRFRKIDWAILSELNHAGDKNVKNACTNLLVF